MQSPFPKSSSAAGQGRVVAALLPNGLPGLEAVAYQYPLKLISPSPTPDQKSALVFLLSYGGGLVGGDSVHLDVEVRKGAKLSIVTQGHTKIFNSPSADIITRQDLRVRVSDGAGLCLLPDPVQPFDGSVYEQTQKFTLTPSASLCLLDWVTQGRSARGEDWSFIKWKGCNEVWLTALPDSGKDRLLVRDTIVLDESSRDLTGRPLRGSMHGHGIVGTLILRGQQMAPLGDFFLSEFGVLPRLGARDWRSAEAKEAEDSNILTPEEQWRQARLELEKRHGVLWSAARIRGCVIVKFGAKTVEGGRVWIGDMISREGSIAKLFGDQALMGVR